jgi:translation elongation factor EF-Tu-like GTPase
MAWFRRSSDDESLDPAVLLARAHDATPVEPAEVTAVPGTGFALTVEDVFSIKGRGTVVTGRVEAGTVSKGSTLRLTRVDGSARDITVRGIEMFRKVVDTANAGDNVGLLVGELGRSDIARGDRLTG